MLNVIETRFYGITPLLSISFNSNSSPYGLDMVMFMLLSRERLKLRRDCWVKLHMKFWTNVVTQRVWNKYDINKSLFAVLFTTINKIKDVMWQNSCQVLVVCYFTTPFNLQRLPSKVGWTEKGPELCHFIGPLILTIYTQ